MPPQITGFFQRFGAGLKGFTAGQRTIAAIGAALLVVGIIALSAWLSKPALTPLFSGLKDTDANGIVEQLRADNVPYELSDGGSTILVPQDKVKVGVFPISSSLPYFVAIEKGYFKENNIEPETIRLMGGPPNVAALMTNQIDVAAVLARARRGSRGGAVRH